MSTTYDLTTDVGKVRLKVGDTDTAAAQFSDEELQVFIDEAGTVNASAGLALLAWANAVAMDDQKVVAGSWTGDRGDVAAKMRAAAKELFDLDGYNPSLAASFVQTNVCLWGARVDE